MTFLADLEHFHHLRRVFGRYGRECTLIEVWMQFADFLHNLLHVTALNFAAFVLLTAGPLNTLMEIESFVLLQFLCNEKKSPR
jgi:hypothetical protein